MNRRVEMTPAEVDERKARARARAKAWYAANRERALEYHAAYRAKHAEKKKVYFRAYYRENSDLLRARARMAGPAWQRANPDKVLARANKYRAAKLRAIPRWADHAAIEAIYAECVATNARTGEAWHVDHIVPLQSEIVCGLHVVDNLQIMPGRENQSKGNRLWPDMP